MTNASTMLERVARAIYRVEQPDTSFEYASPEAREECIAIARAAIEAMREPTDAMVEAGARAFHDAARDKGALRWETASEKYRQDMRDLVRPVVIATLATTKKAAATPEG